jgi:hypothetical protein
MKVTNLVSFVPGMLANIQDTKKFIDWVSGQIFEELKIPREGRGVVEYRYLENFWYLSENVVCVLREKGGNTLEDGACVLDQGTEVGGYHVFKMLGQNGIDLLVLNSFLERKVTP